jgi:hypothetical protein
MNWKQALFVGGAVLLLAACDNATAPKPGLRQVKGAASVKGGNGSTGTSPELMTACRSGFSVQVGMSDSTGTCGVY